eukprot:SAG11_NODE_62_length_19006_cov_6.513143_31_plen_63_part_00
MEKNSIHWLKREIQKDELKLINHKKTLISQIKKVGIKGVLKKPEKKEKNVSLWKKLRNLLNF